MVVLAGRGVVPDTAAPVEAWVTAIVWSPAARPVPAPSDVMPSAAPPEPMRTDPDVTMSSGDATVPAEIWVDPTASWSTAKVSEPVWVPEVTLAEATAASDDAAEYASLNAEGSAKRSADGWSA